MCCATGWPSPTKLKRRRKPARPLSRRFSTNCRYRNDMRLLRFRPGMREQADLEMKHRHHFSFQPPPKFCRVARAVENGHHADEIGLNAEINAVFLEYSQFRHSDRVANKPEAPRILKNAV